MPHPGETVRVALATCRALPRLVEDDRLLQQALESRGARAGPAVWDDPAVGWTELDAVVVRSCWDYHLRPEAFDAWIGRLEEDGVPLWNPPEVLRWNARKTYLRDLEAAGVPIVPTRFIEQSDTRLEAVLVMSASAYGTWRTSRATLARDLGSDRRLPGSGEVLVQPFLHGIQANGEWSLCFFDDRFSHAVLKRPRPGDFRVQSDHGGIHLRAEPPAEVLACAQAALRAAARSTRGWTAASRTAPSG